LIESEQSARRVLPVQERKLYVLPFNQPIIEKITSAFGMLPPDQPIVAGSTISILGKHLQDDPTSTQIVVRIAGNEVVPQDVSNNRIDSQLPNILQAGIQGVQVIQKVLIGDPAMPHNGFESNVVPFVLQPTIKAINPENIQDNGNAGISGNVKVQVDPQVASKQRAVLRLFTETPDGIKPAYSFLANLLTADSDTLTFPITGVKAGTYVMRVLIDGAESVLNKDKQKNQITLP
jgi:hypothetical protein